MEKICNKDISLGDRIKMYEHMFTQYTVDPSIPFLARVDGRSFSTFTSKLTKPFDHKFTYAMCETAKVLVDEFRPVLAYVQSDEISLLFKPCTDPIFNGKLSKLNSVIASTATIWFNEFLGKDLPVNGFGIFDCRVFNVPDEWEAVNALRFRYRDAFRNAVSAAARANFGHSKTLNMNTDEKLEMLGDLWNNYPDEARFGQFYRKVNVELPVDVDRSKLDPAVAAKIPETCIRSKIVPYEVSGGSRTVLLNDKEFGITEIVNLTDVIFRGAVARYGSNKESTDGD